MLWFHATAPVDGALCEYVAVDEAFAHLVPDTLTAETAALLEPCPWACGPAARAVSAPAHGS